MASLKGSGLTEGRTRCLQLQGSCALVADSVDSRKWEHSPEFLERARRSLPRGVSSPFRAVAPVPLYFADATGSRLTDVDGSEYVDFGLAWDPLILGRAHSWKVEAPAEAAAKPHISGA